MNIKEFNMIIYEPFGRGKPEVVKIHLNLNSVMYATDAGETRELSEDALLWYKQITRLKLSNNQEIEVVAKLNEVFL